MEKIKIDKKASQSLDKYLEYRRIVGDEDGGTLFTPAQYEQYKKRVVPQRMNNRLYVSFGVPGEGLECKLVGPETQCFCSHRYKQHKTDFEVLSSGAPLALPCQVKGCRCTAYQYVALSGSRPVRCRCKHTAEDHSEAGRHFCNMCSSCSGFQSPYTCGCGQPSYAHHTLVETRQQRLAEGKPVGRDVPYKAMGGLTGFSSLADGYLRLDAHQGPETQSASETRREEEDDMAYFERRYQERLKADKISKGLRIKDVRQPSRITVSTGQTDDHGPADLYSNIQQTNGCGH
ncbi:protein FAM221A [Gadus chalcogrammus]|uniref:protein FAM221A n=1 Tax=Gadus chalcogrammus TaxID=1042646 RepID=UPI0024C4CD62|nr:protein FAM221A [Gadus chalcogrammus]